jgi:multiple sugar transport system substrate-binding protein
VSSRIGTKRTLVAALCLALVTMLSGCVVTSYAFDGAHPGKTTITLWSDVGVDPSFVQLDKIFHEKYPNIIVRHAAVDMNNFGPKLVAAAGEKDGPDVIIGNPVVDFPLTAAGKVYADVSKYWAKSPARKEYPEAGLWKQNGKLLEFMWRFADLGFWYNKTILDEFHLKPPTTVAEVNQDMAIVTKSGKYKGIALSGDATVQSTWIFMMWLLAQGVNYCNIDSPQTPGVFSMIDGWRKKGYLPPDVSTLNMNDAFMRFLTGQYAFAEGGSWELPTVAEADPKFQIGTSVMPAGKGGSHVSFAGESIAMGAFSKHKDAAWKYIETAFLSNAGELATFKASGQIPPRKDTRTSKAVTDTKYSGPFITELQPKYLKPWPNNTKTLDAQTDLGVVQSNMLAGAYGSAKAAKEAVKRVKQDFKEGGGGC